MTLHIPGEQPPLGKLTDDQLTPVLGCLNTGPKALLHVVADPFDPQTGKELYESLIKAQSSTVAWAVDRNIARQSIQKCGLEESGSFESVQGEKGLSFQITEAGRGIIRPMAAHMIALTLRHGIGTNEIIGDTSGHKFKSDVVLNRLSVLGAVLKHGSGGVEFAPIDLFTDAAIKNHSTYSNHIRILVNSGILETVVKQHRNAKKLTETGEVVLNDYFMLLRGLITLDPDFFHEGQILAKDLKKDSTKVSDFMAISLDRSNLASRRPIVDAIKYIKSLLSQCEGPLTTSQIGDALGYHTTQVGRILCRAADEGDLSRTQNGRTFDWTLTNPSSTQA